MRIYLIIPMIPLQAPVTTMIAMPMIPLKFSYDSYGPLGVPLGHYKAVKGLVRRFRAL